MQAPTLLGMWEGKVCKGKGKVAMKYSFNFQFIY